jgi:hypothetical protein
MWIDSCAQGNLVHGLRTIVFKSAATGSYVVVGNLSHMEHRMLEYRILGYGLVFAFD